MAEIPQNQHMIYVYELTLVALSQGNMVSDGYPWYQKQRDKPRDKVHSLGHHLF